MACWMHRRVPAPERPFVPDTAQQGGDSGAYPRREALRRLRSTSVRDSGQTWRWRHSTVDLQAGRIREWVPALQQSGIATGWEVTGGVWRNVAS